MNIEKLNKYLSEGTILEFETDRECMEFFKIEDFQEFKTVEEMYKFQGKYGFSIGARRYHILTESALEVLKNDFTYEELNMLIDGMLCLIRNNHRAAKELYDSKAIETIEKVTEEYRKLNNKLCEMLG